MQSIIFFATFIALAAAACDRSPKLVGAEDLCWSSKVKIVDRVQYTAKSVLNFAKEKLGLGSEEQFNPQQCDYYECIFAEMNMLNHNGFPNEEKLVEFIDNNVIYTHAKAQYERLKLCQEALAYSISENKPFLGAPLGSDASPISVDIIQPKCEILQEFMKCLALNGTDCVVFKYP
ncbi:uncharacterized protein LOC126747493 [Anthonomus grandis grandis]|uniref:uncharacterized protein LOC126747493 n=1 Tax=Anthonomus grandis grandis TaxID=2921223 RepID=UPI0021653E01|nr:uncharacterized protein LOC126747493 [Anthonomus grandis grandis]